MTSRQSTIDQWMCFLHCRTLMRGTDGFPSQKGKCRWYGTLMLPLLLDWTKFGLPAILGALTIYDVTDMGLVRVEFTKFWECVLSLACYLMAIYLEKTKYIYFYHCWTLKWHRHLKTFPVDHTLSIPWPLMIWRRKAPGQKQSCYWPSSPGIFRPWH